MTAQRLMIRCPKTGMVVPTGIAMDPASFATAGMQDNATQCPACGEAHVWSKENTFWESQN